MNSNYKYKIIIGGSLNPNSLPFFQNFQFDIQDYDKIGFSLNPIECITDHGDSFLFVFWYLCDKEKYQFMIPSFCHGARGAIITIDQSIFESLLEAKKWIKVISKELKNIPILLLTSQSNDKHIEITEREIAHFKDINKIECVFSYYPDKDYNYCEKKEFFKSLIKIFNGIFKNGNDFSIILPTEEQKFLKFYDRYVICPLCKNKNHFESLKNFYFASTHEEMILREKFFELVDKQKAKNSTREDQLKIGILCCSCYRKCFEKE